MTAYGIMKGKNGYRFDEAIFKWSYHFKFWFVEELEKREYGALPQTPQVFKKTWLKLLYMGFAKSRVIL